MKDPVYLKALEHASYIKGGDEELAAHLGVPEHTIGIWRRGLTPIPQDVFLKLVDVMFPPEPAERLRPRVGRTGR